MSDLINTNRLRVSAEQAMTSPTESGTPQAGTPRDESAKNVAFLEEGAAWGDEACIVGLAEIERLQAALTAERRRADDLLQALKVYGEHAEMCSAMVQDRCDCGLDTALAAGQEEG